MKNVLVRDSQFLDAVDFERFGTLPIDALMNVVGDVIGYEAHWAGFTIERKSAQIVEVSPGRYYDGRIVYEADDVQSLNLTTYFPLSGTSDEKYVALILRGEIVEDKEERAFETSIDPETQVPVSEITPVIQKYRSTVIVQQGSAAPPPAIQPAIDETDCCICLIRLTTLGVQEIIPGSTWRAKSLAEVEGRVTALELRVDRLFSDTETIRTDLGNVAAEVDLIRRSIPDARVFSQVVRDTARHSQVLNLPEEARNYWFDQALLRDQWDFAAGGYFRINEGIRFSYINQFDHQLRLIAYDDPAISVFDNRLVMPAYDEVVRLSSPEGSGRKDIANTVHTITTAVQHTQSHTRIRYGETVTVCENMAGWDMVGGRRAGEVFQKDGEQWRVADELIERNKTQLPNHDVRAVQRLIEESYTSTYTTYNTETFGLSGAVFAQSFLCSQIMVATSIDLNFTRIGPTGDVLLCLCEVGASGAPDFLAVLAKINVPRERLVNGWNKFRFEPTLLEQGKRYAWFTVTSGNHQLMSNTGNAFTGGTLFLATDGAFSQGTVTEDFTFRLNAARFRSNRIVLPFTSLNLEGGMSELSMIFKGWAPAATRLAWEIRLPGNDTQWVPLDARIDNPLATLPPLVQLRAVMVGTEDVAPAINLDQWARCIVGRMAPTMRAISKLIRFGFATGEAQIVLNMDAFDANRHTVAPKLVMENGTVIDPLSVTSVVDAYKPTRTKVTANFKLPAAATGARVRIDATTNSVLHIPFGQDIQLNAF